MWTLNGIETTTKVIRAHASHHSYHKGCRKKHEMIIVDKRPMLTYDSVTWHHVSNQEKLQTLNAHVLCHSNEYIKQC
jgi:hypothetical protein